MPIRDNRILIDAADAVTNFIDDGGGTMSLAAGTSNIEGSGAIEQQVSAARAGTFYDAGVNQDWSDNVFYIWWNVTTANLLASIGALGVTMRFASGATPNANYFEVAIAGSDVYSGGYTMSVVDIERARELALSSPTNNNAATGGTPPATSAIQYVGIMWDIGGMIPGTDPNCFLDALWRLPVGQPGIIVSGENTGASPNPKPWNWDDIVDAGDIADTAKAWGTIEKADGVIKLNTPIQFGASGSPNTDHDFEDTLAVVAWKSELVEDSFYGMSFVGDGVNTQRWQMGVSGSAGQGLTMLAATDGPRWFIDASDANLDAVNFLGCSLSHSSYIDIDSRAVTMTDSLLIDGQRVWHSRTASPRSGADFERNNIIAAAPSGYDRLGLESPPGDSVVSPESDVSYIHTSDPNYIVDCVFIFSEGHAIQIKEVNSYDFIGNTFTGYGADDTRESAIHAPRVTSSILIDDAGYGVIPSPNNQLPFDEMLKDGDGEFRGGIIQGASAIGSIASMNLRLSRNKTFGAVSPQADVSVRLYRPVVGTPGAGGAYIAGGIDSHFAESQKKSYTLINDTGIYINNTFGLLFSPQVPIPTTSPDWIAWLFYCESRVSPSLLDVGINAYRVTFRGRIPDVKQSPEQRDHPGNMLYADRTAQSPEIQALGFGFISPEPYNSRLEFRVFSGTTSLTLNVTDGDTPTIDGTATINNNVSVTLTNIQPGTEVRVYPAQDFNSPQDLTEIAGIEDTGSPTEFTFTASAGQLVDIVVLNQDYVLPPANRIRNFEVPATSTSFPISQIIDRNFSNP